MVLYVGSENEIRQIKIFKWVFDGTTFDLTKHAIAYDEILAVTHPQHRTLGVDRLTVVADHEQENTAEPELVAGPTVLGSAEQLPLLEAQKMLTEVLAKLGQVFDEPPAVGRKSLVRWTKVLSLYNEALEKKAKTAAPQQAKAFRACRLFTLDGLSAKIAALDMGSDSDIAFLFEATPQQWQHRAWRAEVQELRNKHGAAVGDYFVKRTAQELKSSTQCSFEVPLTRIGKKSAGALKGLEFAFTKPPADARHSMNVANLFAFARDTANAWLSTALAVKLDDAQTIAAASAIDKPDRAALAAIFTIFCFNRMVSLSDGRIRSGEKDKYGLLFKTPPDDLIRAALSTPAKRALEAVAALADRRTHVEALVTPLINANPSTMNLTSSKKAAWVTDLADYAERLLFPAVQQRYPNETATRYGTRVDRCAAADELDIATGKPLPVREYDAGRFAVVVETRDTDNRFSLLVATNPRAAVNTATVSQDLGAYQQE